ncbi:YchJ family protein [Pseudoalteromonas sp. PS5]|uniref:YchJ family protein n=1 Tax=Pseudoalteromonas sp. PS5 TaxID=1437473 RepID=UPI00240D3FED|nr:YchJ family protein [Pseudoalteromonas sp. PS5]
MFCYCNSSTSYSQCCEPYITGVKTAETPQKLMRSRYSAYCVKDADYIHNTYSSAKRPDNSVGDIAAFADYAKFIKLEVLEEIANEPSGIVEFKAYYIAENCLYTLHERSSFIVEQGAWKYVDGELYDTPVTKVGRNDLCPCGSNKKYKKCHAT